MNKTYVLPLRDLVVHPGMTVPVYLDNQISVNCLSSAAAASNKIILVPQHSWGYPTTPNDIFDTGTMADIVQILHMPDKTIHLVVKTTDVVQLSDIQVEDGLFMATPNIVSILDDMEFDQTLALRDKIADLIQSMPFARKIKTDKLRNVIANYPLPAFVDTLVQILDIPSDVAVQILTSTTWREKLLIILEQIGLINEMSKIDDAINKRIHQQMEGGRREAVLHEKLRAIQKELGDDDDVASDAESLKKRIKESHMPVDAKEKAMSELRRMKSHNAMSTEGAVLKTYLEELLSMPWDKSDKSEIDLSASKLALDAEHSGMSDVKERILEHIAVMKKTGQNSGTILCLVGAPGVGKTSLGKSVATALGRKYHRISLGGVHDEAVFRGHRKTYIGSQPGRIMDALKRCGSNNPVIVLDEIDKIGRDHRGDPESALLEILDPEQNKSFRDHYLEVDFDLSNVLFIATANSLNMSQALKDRMEIIEIPSYSEDEKVTIAREHLVARAAKDTGWNIENIKIDDNALRHIIRGYTAESGVRELQRAMTAMLRRELLKNNGIDSKTDFNSEKIDELLKTRRSANANHKIGFSTARI